MKNDFTIKHTNYCKGIAICCSISISTRTICYLGEKSMDIYYIHMFITTYYLSDLIYSINNVFFMIVAVIILSLIWSYGLNIIRKITSWDKLIMIGSKKNLTIEGE